MYDLWYKISRDKNIGINLFVEAIISLIYSSRLKAGDAAIDGGANRGLHLMPMIGIVGSSGLAIGFEAFPRLAVELKSKLGDANCGIVLNKALGRSVGETDFLCVRNSHTRSGILEQDGLSDSLRASIERIRVEMTTIDKESAELGIENRLRFIKLDLEGGELDALRGADFVMRNSRPLIVLENGREKSAKLYGYDRSEWFSIFTDRGYKIFDVFGREFRSEDWNRPAIPPYCIAAARLDDIEFVEGTLPHLISVLSAPFKTLMEVMNDKNSS